MKNSQDLIPKNYQIETNLNARTQSPQIITHDLNHKKTLTNVDNSRPKKQNDSVSSNKERHEEIEETPELGKKAQKNKDTADAKALFVVDEPIKKVLVPYSSPIQMDKNQYEKEYNTNLTSARPFSFGEKDLIQGSKVEIFLQPRDMIRKKVPIPEEFYENHSPFEYLEPRRQVTPDKIPDKTPNQANQANQGNKGNQSNQANKSNFENKPLVSNNNVNRSETANGKVSDNQPKYRQPDYKSVLKKDIPTQHMNERVEKDSMIVQNNSYKEEDNDRLSNVVIISEKPVQLQKQQNQNISQLLQSFNKNPTTDGLNKLLNSSLSADDANFEFSFDEKANKKKGKKKKNETKVSSIKEETEENIEPQTTNIKAKFNKPQLDLPVNLTRKNDTIDADHKKDLNQNVKLSGAPLGFEAQRLQLMVDYKKRILKIEDTLFGSDSSSRLDKLGSDSSSRLDKLGSDSSSRLDKLGSLRYSEVYEGPKKLNNLLVPKSNGTTRDNSQNQESKRTINTNKIVNKKFYKGNIDESIFDSPNKAEEFLNNQTFDKK